MSGTQDEIEDKDIEIVEEVENEGQTPDVSDELENYSQGVQKRINQMRAQLGEQERRNAELSQNLEQTITVARRIAEENDRLKKERASSDEAVFDGLVGSLTSDLTVAKQELRAAHEAADADKIVDATARVSMLAADLRRAQVAKAGLKVQPEPKPNEDPAVARRVGAWMDRNKDWFQKDPEKTRVALAADAYVRAMGFNPSTEDYYEEVDRIVAERYSAPTRATPARGNGGAQPVSAQGRSSPPTAQRKVSLTADEVALARRLGISPEDYAKTKAAGTAII